ncbi:MAG: malonate decarboxylase subunit alpha [Planctomycetia bacterium]|nr:malonate decarboxylase subunit alpha [Planctomycetia bacterium]
MTTKPVLSASEAIHQFVQSDMTVAVEGFVGLSKVEELLIALREEFLQNHTPRNLTVVHCAGQGNGKSPGCGMNRLAVEGLIGKLIAGHFAMAPDIQKLILENKIAAYNLPQGVISHLYRDIAAGKPGTITHVGLGTFVDPELDGARLNPKAWETGSVVERVRLLDSDYLLYKAFPINVALIRATTADRFGNCSLEKEAVTLEATAMAQATKNSGGHVIVQVERVVDEPIDPRMVKIPGIYVDALVVAKPENHWMTNDTPYNPGFSGETRLPVSAMPPLELTERKVIARRAAQELTSGAITNLGIGMPEGIGAVAAEENRDDLVLTTEAGTIGGYPASGGSFGAALNPDCILTQPEQFDFYDGGGLDIAFLGLAQVDRCGNINVSKFGPKVAGCGGFINITQNAKKVVFCGTLTAGGLKVRVADGQLTILQEGRAHKFVESVEQITFSGAYALRRQQPVLYITERAVFKLVESGLELTEIAPGVDLNRDILAQIDFPVLIRDVKPMDSGLFLP